jgi:hypothetical protein
MINNQRLFDWFYDPYFVKIPHYFKSLFSAILNKTLSQTICYSIILYEQNAE